MELFVNINDLIPKDHSYRKFLKLLDFSKLTTSLEIIKKNQVTGRKGYRSVQIFKMLLLQFIEDLSDRELERFLRENMAAKFFCDFSLSEKTPDHSFFGSVRSKIGIENISKIFNRVQNQLKKQGFIKEVFTFVDASSLVSKLSTWEERDKAIKLGEKKLNNAIINKLNRDIKEKRRKNSNNLNKLKTIFFDSEARYGCKGKNKFWFGYKRNASVDMQSGLINKIQLTRANVGDDKVIKNILPRTGAIFGDKGYCTKYAVNIIKTKGLHDCTIKKNNMIGKNKDKDRWISQMRAPYERTFSQMSKKVRYSGIKKNQFAEFMNVLSFNLKRLTKLEAPPILI